MRGVESGAAATVKANVPGPVTDALPVVVIHEAFAAPVQAQVLPVVMVTEDAPPDAPIETDVEDSEKLQVVGCVGLESHPASVTRQTQTSPLKRMAISSLEKTRRDCTVCAPRAGGCQALPSNSIGVLEPTSGPVRISVFVGVSAPRLEARLFIRQLDARSEPGDRHVDWSHRASLALHSDVL